MTITMNGKEYNIKFGNKAVARAGFISKLARIGVMQSSTDDGNGANVFVNAANFTCWIAG